MWPNPQFLADLPHLLKKFLIKNFIFCAVELMQARNVYYQKVATWMHSKREMLSQF